MTIDELIARLMRLGEESPRRDATEVRLKFEWDVGIEGVSLAMARLPRGRGPMSPVVFIHAVIAQPDLTTRRVPVRDDRSEEGDGDRTVREVNAEATRYRLCRAVARGIDVLEAATGERSRPLEHLLRVVESESLVHRKKDKGAGQLWLFDDHQDADFTLAARICEATGAVVIHSGSRAVYRYKADRITMPRMSRYRNRASYYVTRFRLTAHWAGKRLGWRGPCVEGELVAVLASYLLAEAAGVPVVDTGSYRCYHAAWLRWVRKEPGFLARALHHATRAADLVLGYGGNTGSSPHDTERG